MKVGKKMSNKSESNLDESLNETKLIALGFSYLGHIPVENEKKKVFMSKHYEPKNRDLASYFIVEHKEDYNIVVFRWYYTQKRYKVIENLSQLQAIHNFHAVNDILSFSNIEKK